MARRATPKDKKPAQPAKKAIYDLRTRRIAVFAFAFSGMAALMYEVLWTRELELVFGSTVYAVSMMLAAFMSGLSLGAFLGGKWADRSPNLLALFAKLEFGIAVFGLLSLPLVQLLPTVYFYVYDALRPPFAVFFFVQLLMSFVIMLVPTTFMGATFPVVSKLNTAALDELGTDVGNVYSINTLGSIIGSLATGFLLIPLVGVQATTFIAAAVNLGVAMSMFWISRSFPKGTPAITGGVVLAGAILVGAFSTQSAFAHNFYRIGDYQSFDEYIAYRDALVTKFFADDIHGRVVVFETPSGERYLQNSGKIEGSTGSLDAQTTSMLALLPIAAATNPQHVLVVGLGTGLTTRAALSADVERVDTIEINQSVVEASRLFVGDDVESDPRSTIIVTDARNHLAATDSRYDVVTSEPSYPLSSSVSHLFTLEFYELVESRLNDDGVFLQWLPRYLLTDEDTTMMIKTFAQVFPNAYVWGSNQGADEAVDLMLVGVRGERRLDPAVVEATLRASVDIPLDIGFFGGPEEVAALTSDPTIPLNTDDRPILEFRTPRNQIDLYRARTEAIERR